MLFHSGLFMMTIIHSSGFFHGVDESAEKRFLETQIISKGHLGVDCFFLMRYKT